MTLSPAAVHLIGEWIHPAGLITGVVAPNLRAFIRRIRGAEPAYHRKSVVHDAMSGIAFPSFLVLCALPLAPDLLHKLNHEHLAFAGVLGIIFVISEVVDGEDD